MTVAAVLLAAGLSRRFGSDDKLSMPLNGTPLALHAAGALAALPVEHRIVVTGRQTIDWPSFTIVTNDQPESGMARSLAFGVRAARALGADAVLVALADMPFVSPDHFAKLLAAGRGADSIVASSDGARRMPPALFGGAWFPTLERLTGDAGARMLLHQADEIVATPAELMDIDDPLDLRTAERAGSPST